MLQSYPSLTPEEFTEACQSFEDRCHDSLSGTDWSRVEWTGKELRITQSRLTGIKRGSGEAESLNRDEEKYEDSERILENQDCDGDDEDNEVEIETEVELEEVEEEKDQAVRPGRSMHIAKAALYGGSHADSYQLLRHRSSGDMLEVTFSMTLSPTYSVPILWFSSIALKGVEDVHRLLVAPHLNDAVKDVGVMGGISRAYHPVSGLPAFFVHPCNTHEALLAAHNRSSLTAQEYLLLLLGVIGSAVGLHVPSKLLV